MKDHLPKFKSTVWVNNLGYISLQTFQQHKLVEALVAEITFSAIWQKLITKASDHIYEDKTLCKSIMEEYVVAMKLQIPACNTKKLGSMIPAFRSFVTVDKDTYTGDVCITKKEAEQ
ncbi:hypothetical protein L2E82_48704 [Cichorium intybus]|uniref:Uncharacterized protein n=1 Tax=Cichorium intybus TaxID=13427 RepID=A0ACB8YZW3_CICIN|nr:hypothetical protein L2E82_48704 [Cichorium intybus]